ncbi:hypothetical protein L208DRAFT_651410 [Tricholoma matsutake]|nr:hypothetical protein L208DRAFT_651410 [Tricholoma matsutake 945]
MSSIDLSQPLATLLRETTRHAHEKAERSSGATTLVSGKLSLDDYIRQLMMLWYIYDALERALDRHATHPSLEPTYNPTLLARAPSLAADISYLLQVPETSWTSHPACVKLRKSMPTSLTAYVSRIEEQAPAADPTSLLAHSYVRYLGDLSGGQIIRRMVSKTYGLDENAGPGLSFYAFKSLTSQNAANQGEMNRIKEWFREGMNTAGNLLSVDVKASVVEEANIAFELNTALLNAIQTPSAGTEAVETPKNDCNKADAILQVRTVIVALFLAHLVLFMGSEFKGNTSCLALLGAPELSSHLLR